MKNTIFTPEEKILILCSRVQLDTETQPQIEDLLRQEIDWQRLSKLLNYHHITPLVYHHLTNINHKLASEEFLLHAKIKTNECIVRSLLLWKELNLILSPLKENGIKAIPMKGILFAESVYKNLALRELGDLDILILKKDLTFVDEIIRGLGYNPLDIPFPWKWQDPIKFAYYQKFIYHFIYQKIEPHLSLPLTLEIHYDILPPMWSRKKFLSDIWLNAKEVNISGVDFLAMSLEDLLIYLSIKCFSNFTFYITLRDLCDISELIKCYGQQIDWDKIIKKTKSYNLASMLYYCLYFTKDLLISEDYLIPKKIIFQLRPSLLKRFFLNRIITKEKLLNGSDMKDTDLFYSLSRSYIFDIMSIHGFRYTLRLILNILYNYGFKEKLFETKGYRKRLHYLLRFIKLPFLSLRLFIRVLFRYF